MSFSGHVLQFLGLKMLLCISLFAHLHLNKIVLLSKHDVKQYAGDVRNQ